MLIKRQIAITNLLRAEMGEQNSTFSFRRLPLVDQQGQLSLAEAMRDG
jgi:hypothetical protein